MKQIAQLRTHLSSVHKALTRSDKGSITVLASISIVAVIIVCGAMVDYARMTNAKTSLAAAVDAAVLQAATSSNTDLTVLEALAESTIERNYSQNDHGTVSDVTVASENGQTTVTATAEIEMAFMSMTGIDSVTIEVSASAIPDISLDNRDIEVALVTDMSGGGDVETLKSAARSFSDLLVSVDHTDATKRLALVPTGERVYLGSRANDARGTVTSNKCTTPGCEWYLYIYNNPNVRVSTGRIMKKVRNCVTERTGDYAYTDDAPSTASVGRYYGSKCDSASNEMVPLTSSSDALNDSIDGWTAEGGRAGQIGIAWAWYALSPTFDFFTGDSAPTEYADPDTAKSVVIVSGGAYDTAFCKGVVSKDSTSSNSLKEWKINCDAQNGDPNAQALKLCTAMKDKGIAIYTVTIGSDSVAATTLTGCATGSDQTYAIGTVADLDATLVAIAVKIRAAASYATTTTTGVRLVE